VRRTKKQGIIFERAPLKLKSLQLRARSFALNACMSEGYIMGEYDEYNIYNISSFICAELTEKVLTGQISHLLNNHIISQNFFSLFTSSSRPCAHVLTLVHMI